jgi:hypothetical protein
VTDSTARVQNTIRELDSIPDFFCPAGRPPRWIQAAVGGVVLGRTELREQPVAEIVHCGLPSPRRVALKQIHHVTKADPHNLLILLVLLACLAKLDSTWRHFEAPRRSAAS